MPLAPLTLHVPDPPPEGVPPGQPPAGLWIPLAELLQHFDVQLVPKSRPQARHADPAERAPDGLNDLQRALLAAADGEERSRKSIIRRAGRTPTSCCYAALRALVERGLLKPGAHGGLCRP